ncbi:hypothetical protein MKW92_049882 [Papaver armeniacum]|nr:hypothetical protein MKW92_049882 [Papaver armeniacum]
MENEIEGLNFEQKHGKSRVRVGKIWRKEDGNHFFVEWNVNISLLSDCLPAYVRDDNSDIVANDTMKNTVYAKAKECSELLSVEEFAIELGKHFTTLYPQVTTVIINIVEMPWERVSLGGQPHQHGFKLGYEKHTAEAIVKKSGAVRLTSGWGFEGFVRDKYTALPETRERMLATEVSASWKYVFESLSNIPVKSPYFTEKYLDVNKVMLETFFGPPKEGVYSASVQKTLYQMARVVLSRFPDVASIQLRVPNLQFLPVNLPNKDSPTIVKFNDDVFTPTEAI